MGGPSLAVPHASLPVINFLVISRVKMAQFQSLNVTSRDAPRAAPDLERLFGVTGMAQGRKISMSPWMHLFASDLTVRDQVKIGLQFVALGLVPPLAIGALLALAHWLASTPPGP